MMRLPPLPGVNLSSHSTQRQREKLMSCRELCIWHDQLLSKPPGTGEALQWHQDAPLWPILDPVQSRSGVCMDSFWRRGRVERSPPYDPRILSLRGSDGVSPRQPWRAQRPTAASTRDQAAPWKTGRPSLSHATWGRALSSRVDMA